MLQTLLKQGVPHFKRFLILALIIFGVFSFRTSFAADPGDLYLQFYFQLQEAQKSEKNGDFSNALRLYQVSYSLLNRIKEDYPDWRPDLINYRTRFCREKVNALRGQSTSLRPTLAPTLPATASSEELRLLKENLTNQENELLEARKTNEQSRNALALLQKELNQTRTNQITQQEQRKTLEEKLAQTQKELQSLIGQTTDSRVEKLTLQLKEIETQNQQAQQERAKSLEKLALTEKEVTLLKEGSEHSQATIQTELLSLKKNLTEKEKLNFELQEKLTSAQKALEISQQENTALRGGAIDKRVTELLEANAQLSEKLKIAESQMYSTNGATNLNSDVFRGQMETIKQQLISAETHNAKYEKTISDLRTELDTQKEKFLAMELALQQTNTTNAPALVQSLQQENEVFRTIIDRQLKEQARRESAKKIALEELQQLKIQSKVLTMQIEILASPTLLLSENELALLKDPSKDNLVEIGKISAPLDESSPESAGFTPLPPPTMEAIAKEAKALFNTKNYEKAEEKFLQILERYPDNVYALSNLGVVYFQQGKYQKAEASLTKAIKFEPQDGFSHSILGIVYYMTQRYDDAINTLSRAIALDPKDPQSRNYLGIACSQKGWLSVAEQELRKAVEINPNYAEAHFNLAIVYAAQKPPAKEFAQQHYQEAIKLGLKPDKNLEKMLE